MNFSTKLAISCILLAMISACRDSSTNDPPPTNMTTVVIGYEASTIRDPSIEQRFPACVRAVGVTHVHASWRNFIASNMMAVNQTRWELTFTDVPINQLHSFRINDPNGCDTDPNGAVTVDIFANGTRLTNVVGTPGNGTEPGLSFTVNSTGTVTP